MTITLYVGHSVPYPGPADAPPAPLTPNTGYSPALGRHLYRDAVAVLSAAERLGFAGAVVIERHQSAAGTVPAAGVLAAQVLNRTRRAPVITVLSEVAVRLDPVGVAEQVALLDVLGAGRAGLAVACGPGSDHFARGLDPVRPDQLGEALDVLVAAWTSAGPRIWQGEHYSFPWLNIWPRPWREPHPPVWLAGAPAEARRRSWPVLVPPTSAAERRRVATALEGSGGAPVAMLPVHVAASDAQALDEAGTALSRFRSTELASPGYLRAPPAGADEPVPVDPAELVAAGYAAIGSPATVAAALADLSDAGYRAVVVLPQIGGIARNKVWSTLYALAAHLPTGIAPSVSPGR